MTLTMPSLSRYPHSLLVGAIIGLAVSSTHSLSLHTFPRPTNNNIYSNNKWFQQSLGPQTVGLALAALVFLTTSPALADEYGVETEAPTLFTGETVLVS
jgi:hypothetical protein